MRPAGYRLPLHDRLLYASGSLGSQAVLQALLLWAVAFYAPPADADRAQLLPIGLVGILVFFGRFVDVVSDPLVGFWSDRVRFRWGRRIPFILIGAPIMAVAFVLLWTPTPALPQAALAAYLFFSLGLFFIGHTVSGRPYDALLPEVALTSRERVNIAAQRVFLGTMGAVLGLVVSGLLIERFGFVIMGAVLGAVALITRYTAVAGVWRWANLQAAPATTRPSEMLALLKRNRPFRFYLPSFVLLSMGIGMLTQVVPFHVAAVLRAGEQTVSLLMAIFLGLVIVFLPLSSRLAARKGKRWVFSRALLATGLVLPTLFIAGFLPAVPPLLQVALVVAVLGVTTSATFALPPALMADVIDHDEDVTGQRREAMYFGVEQGIQKVGVAFSTVVMTQVMQIFGHTAEDPLGIRLIGPLAAVLMLVGLVIFVRGYRLEPRRE